MWHETHGIDDPADTTTEIADVAEADRPVAKPTRLPPPANAFATGPLNTIEESTLPEEQDDASGGSAVPVAPTDGGQAAAKAVGLHPAADRMSLFPMNPLGDDHVMIVGLHIEPEGASRWPPGLFAHLQALAQVLDVRLHHLDLPPVTATDPPSAAGAAAATLQGTRTTALFETLSSCSTASWLMLSGSQWPTGSSHGARLFLRLFVDCL